MNAMNVLKKPMSDRQIPRTCSPKLICMPISLISIKTMLILYASLSMFKGNKKHA